MAHDVFVSYSSKDKPTADAVCAVLESHGIRCWVAPRDILPSQDWGGSIIEAINGARAMVLVFSANANASPQIKREVERAVNKGIPVIPLRIEDVAPTATLEYFISTPHWLDAFTPPLDRHLQYLAEVTRKIVGGPEVSVPPPVRETESREKAEAEAAEAARLPDEKRRADEETKVAEEKKRAGVGDAAEKRNLGKIPATDLIRKHSKPLFVVNIAKYADPIYCITRLIIGLMFACHGGQKILGFPPNAYPGGALPGMYIAAAWIELAGGFLIAFGLFTRVAAFISSGEMAVAYFFIHWTMGFFPIANRGELAISYCWFFFFVFFHGAGRWSIDSLVRKLKANVTATI
jgi:uncharacterized membrane protein YphA (DoxX/SURF4 family)